MLKNVRSKSKNSLAMHGDDTNLQSRMLNNKNQFLHYCKSSRETIISLSAKRMGRRLPYTTLLSITENLHNSTNNPHCLISKYQKSTTAFP
jgi:hypothetical protein